MKHLIFALIGLTLAIGLYLFGAADLATSPALTVLMASGMTVGLGLVLLALATSFARVTPISFVKSSIQTHPALCIGLTVYMIALFSWASLFKHGYLSLTAQTFETGSLALIGIGFVGIGVYTMHHHFASIRRQITPIA